MPDVACVNGHFMALAEATVSVEDRGFQFGDGVYEVIRTYHGRPFELDAHLARLERSAHALDLPQPYSRSQWTQYVLEGIKRAAYPESKIYLQLTRGTAPRDHAFPSNATGTVVMTIREFHPLSREVQDAGVSAIVSDDIRWGRCDIKSVNLLANVLARQQAKQAGVFETILVKDGQVTEGAVSNVMAVKGGTVMTAPEGPLILSGITRAVVLELARKGGIPVREYLIPRLELFNVDELLLTGTTVEVVGVVKVDDHVIGTGCPGPITHRLASLLRGVTG
jgi:D-alanine transaminase